MLPVVTSHWPFAVNVASSVSLIFLNRFLLQNCDWTLIGVLSALHMSVTALVAQSQQKSTAGCSLTHLDVLVYALLTDVSMISQNLSLQKNSIAVYQLFKLLMIPTTAVFQYLLSGSTVSYVELIGMTLVIAGVMITTAVDFRTTISGVIYSVAGLISSAGHNVATGIFSSKYKTSPSALVAQTAPLQAASLFLVGPLFDVYFMKNEPASLLFFNGEVRCSFAVGVTCVLAAIVNISLVWCIQRYDAAGANVLGHVKTICVLSIGWAEHAASNRVALEKQMAGAFIVACGIAVYTIGRNRLPLAPAHGIEALLKEPHVEA